MNRRLSRRISFATVAFLRRQPILRGFSFLLALCCFWSFAGAGAAMAAAPDRSKDAGASRRSRFPHTALFQAPVSPFNASSPDASARRRLGAPEPVFWTGQRGTNGKTIARTSLTLLDEVGHPLRPISEQQVRAWKQELTANRPATSTPSAARAALLHVWLGEWQLGQNKQPETAQQHFRQAQRLASHSDRVYGLASYDSAIGLFYEGAFQDAAQAFAALLPVRSNPKMTLRGYDRRACSLWLRHAAACAGYHEAHSQLGIPEPRSLDPLCGIASLAECLRALHLPSDKPTLQRACRVSGEGSTLTDLVAAGPKLGVSVRVVSADEQGLKRLPKPLVAFVERDHFVALVRADNAGVSYLCSDCGAWPGGRVDLTWKQWRAVNPGIYAAITRPGSANDRLFATLTASGTSPQSKDGSMLQVSSRSSLRGLHLTERLHLSDTLTALRGHVVRFTDYSWYGCGYGIYGLACAYQAVPTDPSPTKLSPRSAFGPESGDPVNLVTGEEEYNPPADLTVYNPHGPSIQWERGYRSLRSPGSASYEADDFGQGWTQPYNVQINDPGSVQTLPQLQQGVTTNFSANGTDAPASGLSWDVVLNGTTIASSANPNGWTEAFNGFYAPPTLTPPASAQVSTGYENRFFNTRSQTNQSAYFDVVPAASVAQGQSASFQSNGITAPAAGLQWDIVQGSVTVASSSQSNGWSVSVGSTNAGGTAAFSVTAPQFAPVGSYTVRGTSYPYPTGSTPASAVFSVYGVHYVAVSGTKSLILPNGAAIGFTASTTPTASQPHVSCLVQPGVPILVDWYYSSNTFGGYFVVTMTDRTKWVMTGFTGPYGGGGNRSFLAQVVDRNGNAINMVYGGLDSVNIPLLSAISDNASNILLTIGRGGSGSITSVSDAYGRSVFYQVGGQQGYFLNQVSQIVPTGTAVANAPARYTYGYIGMTNPEGETTALGLHTITVPSPTGSGTSTATINYAPNYCNVSSIVDGNGNTRTYTSVSSTGSPSNGAAYSGAINYTRVTVTNAQGAVAYSNVVGFDLNMNETSRTDGRTDSQGNFTTSVSQKVYSDPNDPYRPSLVYDGNGTAGVTPGNGPYVYQGHMAQFGTNPGSYVSDPTWIILRNNSTVATGEQPNGWGVSYNGSTKTFTVSAPASAAASTTYEVCDNFGPYGANAYFTVLAVGATPPMQYTWDQYGNMTSETSRRGTVTTKTWDYSHFGLGELKQVRVGNKAPTTLFYNEPSGLVSSFSVPLPGTTGSASTATYSYTYDNLGNLLTETLPGNNATSTITKTMNYTSDGSYNQSAAIGQPLTVTDNLGKTTHLRYDVQGNTIGIKDALGNESDEAYDIRNAPLQTILPATGQTGSGHAGSMISYLYSEPSSLATTQWPATSLWYGPVTMKTSYDESSNAIRQVTSVYGSEGELLAVSGSTEPVSYTYDAQYRLSTLKDAAGNTTSYFYNPAGYLAQVVYPGAGTPTAPLAAGTKDTTSFTSYDGAGNRLTRTDGNNVTTTYTYNDPESRLTDITYPSGTIGNVHYAYDAYGRRILMTDGTGSQTFTYDDDDNKNSATTAYAGLPAKTISYSFNSDSSRQTMTITGDPGSFNYIYDAIGRLTNLTDPQSDTVAWKYLTNDWLQSQVFVYGAYIETTTNYSYNALGELTNSIFGLSHSGTIQVPRGQYTNINYDGVGDRLSSTLVNGSTNQTTYSYDNKNQVLQEQSQTSGGYTNAFAYDGSSNGPGNPTTLRGTTQNFNLDNQLVGTGYGYDGNGNPMIFRGATLGFSPENQLVSYGTAQTDGYRGDGLRAWKQTSSGRTYFVYDGDHLILTLSATGANVIDSVYGPKGLVGNTNASLGFDPQGNTSVLQAGNGATTNGATFDAFGNNHNSQGRPGSYVSFGAQEGGYTDSETGLVLFSHRYYDPQTGRWLTRDPLGYKGGVNLYGYTKNNPVNSVDPSGYAQLVGVPGFANSPAHGHEYIVTTCGGTVNPTLPQSFGFWPSGNGPVGGAFNGASPGAINAQSGAINVYSGTNSDPDAGSEPNPSAGQDIEDANGDPAFGQRLCKCIAASAASQPSYSIDPRAAWKGSNVYVCYTWAQDMWDCANGEPSLLDSTLGTATSTLSSLAPL